MRWPVLVGMMCCLACARRPASSVLPPETLFRSMPNPDGCYVQVWDGPKYTGRVDYINGPLSYTHLRNMPNQRNWNRRIVSVRVGPNAIATAFPEENFRGGAYELPPRATFVTLPDTMTRGISSLRIQCSDAAKSP